MSFQHMYVCIYPLVWILIVSPQQLFGDVTVNPEFACPGDTVRVDCMLTVPNPGDVFVSSLARFIVESSNSSLSISNVNSGTGDPLNRLTAVTDTGSSNDTLLVGSLTLSSFSSSDNGLRLGCEGSYTHSGGGLPVDIIETVNLRAADPPSTPTVDSLSATNCTNTLLSWTAPASDRAIERYYLYRDDTLLAVSTDTQHTDTYQLMVNTPYSYSVTANSCAGNSFAGVKTVAITGYTVDSTTLSYNNSTNTVDTNWTLNLNTGTQSLMLAYSLTLVYSYTQSNVTYSNIDTVSFSQLSDVTTHSVIITAPSYITNDTVVTNIIACVSITQQCENTFQGETVCGFYTSETVVALTTVSSLTTSTTQTEPSLQCFSSTIILIIVILLLSVLSITIITLLVVVIVYLLRKIKHLQSLPKEPPHSYEYIDLNVSTDIPLPPKDSAYYSHMQSVGTQSTSDTHNYANLK